MNFKEELVKELGLGAIAEDTMLEDYVKACEAIAVRYHESEVKKLHIQNVSKRYFLFGCVNADKQKLNKLIIADDKESAIAELETSYPYIERWYTIEELNVC